MPFWKSRDVDESLPKNDRGSGSLDDYGWDLRAKNQRITLRLADSDPHQEELRGILELADVELATAVSPRTLDEERVDAPVPVRLFLGTRVSGVVGTIPRGMESIFDETVRRLEDRGDKPRVPVEIVTTRHGARVELQMGRVR